MTELKAGIVMGSDSDLGVMKEVCQVLEELEVEYELRVLSAHRTPEAVDEFIQGAEERGLKVIIAGAGKAAHLPGVIAAKTGLPVIGVPILTSSLSGADSLYSMVQMPSGFPVATVALNGAKNAALLAAQILALLDDELSQRFATYRQEIKEEVLEKDRRLQEIGYSQYLKEREG